MIAISKRRLVSRETGERGWQMAFMDKVGEGLNQAARELEWALDKGKAKMSELQIEMQMDGLAKKLGFLVFDFYRGRAVDQAVRQKVLDDLSRLEDQLWKMRAEAKARAEADAQARAAQKAQSQSGQGGQSYAPGEPGNPPQETGPGGETFRPPNS
jgi:hypothetical protein